MVPHRAAVLLEMYTELFTRRARQYEIWCEVAHRGSTVCTELTVFCIHVGTSEVL